MASLRSVLTSIIARGAYDTALNKWNSLRDLDALLDDMSARRASGRGTPNCSCNSNCVGHSAFYNGKLSLGDINAIVSGIKTCSCHVQSSCSGNVSSCSCNANCSCYSQYASCTCQNVGGCRCVGDGYSGGQCWSYGGYMECPSDNVDPCSCNSQSCSCNANCPCNSQYSCTCQVNTVCSCDSYFI